MSAWEGRRYSTAMISSSKSEASDSRDYGTDVGRLRADNEALAEELQQCQADKDFVWSLWRKLQVANPDITQAIGMVVQREKEKSELKDRKVLEILQIKDDKIEELHAMLSRQGREMQDLQSKKVEHQGDVVTLRNENTALLEKLAQLEDQTRSMKTREQNMDGYHRQVINEMQGEKEVLQKQLLQQQRKVESLESETEQLRAELKTSVVQRDTLQQQTQGFQRDITNKVSQFEQLVKDLESARHLVQKHETQNRQNLLEIEEKNRELETVRRELSELWGSHHQLNEHATQQAELIRQLQSLQLDTQKMLKNQEDAYSIEATSLQQMYAELTTRYDVSKKAESVQRKEMLTLKKQLFERDDTIVQLQHKLDLAHIDNRVHRDEHESFIGMEKDQCENLRTRVDSLLTEIHLLKETIVQKDKIIEDMDNRLDNQTFKFSVDQLKERSHSTPIRKEYRSVAVSPLRARSRSSSPTASSEPTSSGSPRSSSRPSSSPTASAFTEDMRRMSIMAEAKVGELKTLLKLKCDELKNLRVAHDRRLNRLKSIQTNYRLVKEQLKTFEEEHSGPKKNKKLRRSHPRELQKEDSDGVWNELAYFKNEATTLQTQNLKLEEENDVLRVETSQAAATIHELKMALEQEKEELEYQLQKRDAKRTEEENSHLSDVQKQLSDKDNKLDQCRRELEQCQDELREKTNLQAKLLEERRLLRAELTEQKQSASSYRIEIASMKREIDRLEKHLEQGKLLLRREVAAARAGANVARIGRNKRSRRLHATKLIPPNMSSSTEKTSSVCEEPIEEDWEEVSSETEDTLTESDSLGHAIVTAAKSLVSVPSTSTLTSDSMHSLKSKLKQKKLGRRNIPSKRSQSVCAGRHEATNPRGTQTKVYRDASTSPVTHLTSPAVRQSPSQRSLGRKTKPLQQRVDSLQQQLSVLRDSRATALKVVAELKETNQQLQADLGLANQRLRIARQNVQKLSSDYERVNRERDELESRLIGESTEAKHSEHSWKALENRLKSASNEVTRQGGVIKVLKTENESMTDQIKTLQDRLNRAERDNTQKRTLLEDQKSRLKQAKESVQSEASLISDLEARIDQLAAANDKMKIQMESSKRQVGALTKERREHEERYIKLTAELDKKNKQLAEAQCKREGLEVALSEVETTAQDQLHGLATQSEAAIHIAQRQLRATHGKLVQFQKFVKTLLHEVCVRCQQARSLSKQYSHSAEKARPTESKALEKAQSLARDILNISQSDLEDIMSVDLEHQHWETEIEDEKKRDKKWSKKCERLMSSQEDFVLPLVELIMEKMEEREELVHRLHSS